MRIPFYGWLARKVGMIPVRRKRDKKTLRHLVTVLFPRAVAAMQQHGQSVIFFPTGTRLEPNQQQIPNPLVFGLYEQAMRANAIANSASTSITVLGVSLTSGTCWPKKGPLKPGVIRVRTIVIPPGLSKSAFLNALTATINN